MKMLSVVRGNVWLAISFILAVTVAFGEGYLWVTGAKVTPMSGFLGWSMLAMIHLFEILNRAATPKRQLT